MPHYKYSKEDYYKLTNAPCIDVALALGMEINERESDNKAWKMKGEQGLCIYREGGNNWYRFSDGKTGYPIDLVIDKLGCSREYALDFIAKNVINGVSEQVYMSQKSSSSEKQQSKELPKEKIFSVPKHDIKPDRVMAYLIKTRGIEPDIVKEMLRRKMIAEDSVRHNALFFGRDEKGEIRSCAQRGTMSSVQFRGEVAGGNKAYTFAMIGRNGVLRLFESPIDAMSHASFSKLLGKDWTADHRLSTNGCGSYESIKKYIENHSEISSVWFSYDNDDGGRAGAEASKAKLLSDFPDRKLDMHICYPIHGKDWNEDLQMFRDKQSEGMDVRSFVNKNSMVFLYHGFRFEPIGFFPEDSTLSDIAQDITDSFGENSAMKFTYDSFIKASPVRADVFRCADTNQIFCVMGNSNELYQYSGGYTPLRETASQRRNNEPAPSPSSEQEPEEDDEEDDACEMG